MKIAAITTSRADWAELGAVALALRSKGAEVEVLVHAGNLGQHHISMEWGTTVTYGWASAAQPAAFKTSRALIASEAIALEALGRALDDLAPDTVLLSGDRHETLLAAFCAAQMGIPIAHLSGGDVTGGSLDEGWRHAITKISHVHFPTNHAAAERIIRMGEDTVRVHMLGSPAIDRVKFTPLLPLAETTKALRLPDARPFLLFNWQPATPVDDDLGAVVDALRTQPMPVVVVGVNGDPGAAAASELIASVARNRNCRMSVWVSHGSLPLHVYLSAMAHCRALVGNSSSGIYEAPYYGTPVINVGSRQRGRSPHAGCITDVPADSTHIALRELPQGRFPPEEPFGDGHSADKVADVILRGVPSVRKIFNDR